MEGVGECVFVFCILCHLKMENLATVPWGKPAAMELYHLVWLIPGVSRISTDFGLDIFSPVRAAPLMSTKHLSDVILPFVGEHKLQREIALCSACCLLGQWGRIALSPQTVTGILCNDKDNTGCCVVQRLLLTGNYCDCTNHFSISIMCELQMILMSAQTLWSQVLRAN